MTITIIGHGYVGIVAACVFADFGNIVHVIGHTQAKIDRLKDGDPLIYEPGLAEMLQRNNVAGRLIFTTEYGQALKDSSIVFICVGTPPTPGTGEADLTTVFHVAEKIGQHLNTDRFTVVSCKSTVPVGTNIKVKEIIRSVIATPSPRGKQSQGALGQVPLASRIHDKFGTQGNTVVFSVASCPEFLREGTGIHDTLNPDRIVIGAQDQRSIDLLLELHKPFPGERVVTNIPSAELVKYASNSLLATKLSFANMISLFAEKLGADAPKVLRAVGMDNRIGPKNLDVSIGYGGACFPKDVQALIATGNENKIDVSMLEAVERVNDISWKNYVAKVKKHIPNSLSTVDSRLPTVSIAVWGLAFKANTDDIRFSAAVKIVNKLAEDGYTVRVYDPAAMPGVKKQLGDKLQYGDDMFGVVKGADALCILTEWNEFRQADLMKVKSMLKKPLIIDGRNLYEPDKMKELGFEYVGTGR